MDLIAGRGGKGGDFSNENVRRGTAVAVLLDNLRSNKSPRASSSICFIPQPTPVLASAIANAYAEAYLSDKFDANFDASQRATVWLRKRLTDLQRSIARSQPPCRTFPICELSDGDEGCPSVRGATF